MPRKNDEVWPIFHVILPLGLKVICVQSFSEKNFFCSIFIFFPSLGGKLLYLVCQNLTGKIV
jgi:hypothetical protein